MVASALQVVAPVAAPPATSKYYGGGCAILSLIPGGYLNGASLKSATRFRADHTGSLASFKTYFQFQTGYGGGNGGSAYRVEIRADDGTANHAPLMTAAGVLATVTWNQLAARTYKNFPVIAFPTPALLTKGSIYHFVMSNLDASPATNWGSTNHFRQAPNAVPHQPDIEDIFATEKYNPAYGWTDSNYPGQTGNPMEGVTPIYQLNYTDGYIAGNGHMEARASEAIGGSAQVRETFTVSGSSRTVASATIKAYRSAGSSPLVFRLETASGALIEQVSLAASSVLTSSSWVTVKFAAPHTLAVGSSYNMVWQAASGTTYYTDKGIAQGSSYGFAPQTYFGDGKSQYNTGSGWIDWPSGSGKVDLPFFFTCQ
jgi:hypothetical protein